MLLLAENVFQEKFNVCFGFWYNESISYKKTFLWSTKNKFNITENIFQKSHTQQTITIVLHTKKFSFLIFKVTSKQTKTSLFSTTKKKKYIYIYIQKLIISMIFFFFNQNKPSVNNTKEEHIYICVFKFN